VGFFFDNASDNQDEDSSIKTEMNAEELAKFGMTKEDVDHINDNENNTSLHR
jgi:hypothetical protein